MTLKEYNDRHTEYLERKTAELQSKPRQKTYLITYGLDGELTTTVRAANKKDALWLSPRVFAVKSVTAI